MTLWELRTAMSQSGFCRLSITIGDKASYKTSRYAIRTSDEPLIFINFRVTYSGIDYRSYGIISLSSTMPSISASTGDQYGGLYYQGPLTVGTKTFYTWRMIGSVRSETSTDSDFIYTVDGAENTFSDGCYLYFNNADGTVELQGGSASVMELFLQNYYAILNPPSFDKKLFLFGLVAGRQLKGWGSAIRPMYYQWSADANALVALAETFFSITTIYGDQNYAKPNYGQCVVGLCHYATQGSTWTAPMLISTDSRAIEYSRSDMPSGDPRYYGDLEYMGLRWYYTGFGLSQDDTVITGRSENKYPSILLATTNPKPFATAILEAAHVVTF